MYLTFDLGASSLKGGLLNTKGELISTGNVLTRDVSSQKDLVDRIYNLSLHLVYKDLKKKSEINQNDQYTREALKNLKGVGIGVPGYVPEDGYRIPVLVNLGLKDLYLKSVLEDRFGVKIVIENDANAAAWGEIKAGVGKGFSDILMITLGTGVGAGVIIDEKIHRGKLGLSGEIGHMQLFPESGRLCNCSKRGCLETESSGSAIEYYGRKYLSKENISAEEIISLARDGDCKAQKIIDKAGSYLSFAISNGLHIIEFQKVILGGGISQGGKIILDPVRKNLAHYLKDGPDFPIERVVLSSLGNEAALYGLFHLLSD